MTFLEQIGGLGNSIVDVLDNIIDAGGINATTQAAADAAKVEAYRTNTELAKLKYLKEQERADKLMRIAEIAIFALLAVFLAKQVLPELTKIKL